MSARAAAPSPAATRGDATPHDAHHARVKLTPRAAVFFTALFLIAIVAIAPARAYLEQRERLADLQRTVLEMERSNDELRDRIAGLNDPHTLERLAIPRGQAPEPPDCT